MWDGAFIDTDIVSFAYLREGELRGVAVFISGIIDRHFQRVARGTQDIRILPVAVLQDSYAVASQPVGLELTNLLFVTRMFSLNRRGEALGVGFPFTVGAPLHSTGS